MKTNSGLRNLVSALERQQLNTSIALEEIIKDNYYSMPCKTSNSGTHYHYFKSVVKNCKEVIILLHPLGGNSFNWLNLIPYLDKYNVYSLDLPSHGRSSDLKYSKNKSAAYIKWLDDFINELELESPHLVGLSTGARIAAVYSLANIKSVGSLTMLAPALNPNIGLIYQFVYHLTESSSRNLFSLMGNRILCMFSQRDDSPSRYAIKYAFEELRRDQEKRNYLGLRQTMDWLLESADDTTKKWGELVEACPCTAIFGERDQYCTLLDHFYLADAGVNIEIARGAGHLVSFDSPARCAEVISRNIAQSITNKNSD